MKRTELKTAVMGLGASAALLCSIFFMFPSVSGCWSSRDPDPVVAGTRQQSEEEHAAAVLAQNGVPIQRDRLGHVRWIEAGNGELTDDLMRRLPELPLLEWLEVGGGSVTAAGVRYLENCPGIVRLYLHDIPLGDDPLTWASRLTNLEALSLQNTGITGKALDRLKVAGSLMVLNLSDNPIADEDLRDVARFVRLEVLDLQNTKITGAGLGNLWGMQRLNVLNLSHCHIVDSDLAHFGGMPNLRIVYAAGCAFSDEAIDAVRERLPMLAIFP